MTDPAADQSAVAIRTTRDEIAALEYEGPGSLQDAEVLQRRMVAAAEVAKRARVDAVEHLWTAREADRILGRMILAAREAGDLASSGQPAGRMVKGVDTLDTFGIGRDLAAAAVKLAEIPDDIWASWHEDSEVEPTQTSVARAANRYLDALEQGREQDRQRQQRRRELEAERVRILRSLEALTAQSTASVEVPPLRDEETDTSDREMAARAAAPAEDEHEDQDVVRGDAWLAAFKEVERLVEVLEQSPPELPQDRFMDLTVLSARDQVRRVTAAAAVWVRAVNAAYEARLQQ